MATIKELTEVAFALMQTLDSWEGGRYGDDRLLQEAVTLHARLAPVFVALTGSFPVMTTSYPPNVIARRERDLVRQAIGALKSGLIPQARLDGWELRREGGDVEQDLVDDTEPVRTLRELVSEGEAFTYENFADKGTTYGANALSPGWVSWTSRVERATEGILPAGSSGRAVLDEGLNTKYLGNGAERFLRGRSMFLGALQTAIDLVKSEAANPPASEPAGLSRQVFVVHGHDELAKNELEAFLSENGFEPIVLHRQADQGRTIIEKFEDHSDVGFVFVLLTPDEVAYLASEADKKPEERQTVTRARPNVIFEFGYFVGKLGRRRVCCLYTGGVELPSDVSGLLYKPYTNSIEDTFYELLKELRAAGYTDI